MDIGVGLYMKMTIVTIDKSSAKLLNFSLHEKVIQIY